jgi:hypothetical protein
MIYPTLFCSNYFHKEWTFFEKPIPFFMNTALYPRKESTRKKVDSVGGTTTDIFFHLVILNTTSGLVGAAGPT